MRTLNENASEEEGRGQDELRSLFGHVLGDKPANQDKVRKMHLGCFPEFVIERVPGKPRSFPDQILIGSQGVFGEKVLEVGGLKKLLEAVFKFRELGNPGGNRKLRGVLGAKLNSA